MRKKLWVGLLTILMGVCCLFALAACGSVNGGVKGKYYFYQDGEYQKENWVELTSDEWKASDGTSGTYETSGDAIVLYVNFFGSNEIFSRGTVKDGVLTVETAGIVSTFCKDGAKPSGTPSNPNNPNPPVVEKVTITYNANGGSFAGGDTTLTQSENKNSLLTAPDSPTRTNYTFAGWATSKLGSTMWKFDEDRATDGITLWAKWTEKSAVVLSVDGASIEDNNIFMLVDKDTDSVSLATKVVCSSDSVWRLYYDKLGQTEIPTKIAAQMSGSLMNGNNTFYIVVTSQNGAQTSLYELTVHRSYAVSVNFYSGNSLIESQTAYTGSMFEATYRPTLEGYVFNGWRGENGSAVNAVTVWSDISLYADRTAKQYTVGFHVNGGDALETTEQTVTYDSACKFPVSTRTGYSFTGWYSGSEQIVGATGNVTAWKIARDTALTAGWEANTYTLTALSDNENAGTVEGGGDYKYDSSVTLTATTKSGYTFIGWYDENDKKVSSNLSYNVKMGLDTTYTAKWIQVTLVSADTSAGTVTSLTGTYLPGDNTTAKATTRSGYTFIGWYNGEKKLSSDLSYNFTMPLENVTYTAKWIKVTLVSDNTSAGTVSTLTSTYLAGDSATATATTKTGYTFIGWYNGNAKLSGELNYEFTMPSSSVTYTAKWIKVTLVSGNTSAGTVTLLTGTYLPGDSVTATAILNLGYEFDGWYNGNTKLTDELEYTFTMPAENVTYKTRGHVMDEMANFDFESGPTYCTITGVKDTTITEITIPNCVTRIGWGAFMNCSGLISIVLPDSITTIGGYAFDGCSGLTSIEIPDKVKSIERCAFSYCSGLTSIVIPDSTTSIEYGAFGECYGLVSVTIGSGVTSISDDPGGPAFVGCYRLVEVYNKSRLAITAGSTNYGQVAYHAKNVYKQEGGSKLTTDNEGFIVYDSNMIVNYVGGHTSIVIPDGVTSIGDHAFDGCSGLTSIIIPNSVTSIGVCALSDCSSLTSITVADENKKYHSSGNCLIETASGTLVLGCKNSVIPTDGSVTSIGSSAFRDCSGLTSITIPNSVMSIGSSAFDGCSGLTSITIGNGVTSIGDYAFDGCSGLTSITIPYSVTSIGSRAFRGCRKLTSVTFKNTRGWWVSTSSTATSGTNILGSDLANTSTAAMYLKSTYVEYYWRRN